MRSDAVKKGMATAPQRSLFNALGITKEELEKMIAPSSYTGICSVLARELADKAEAKAKMMTEK